MDPDRLDKVDWRGIIRMWKRVSDDEALQRMLFAWLQDLLDGMDTREVESHLWEAANAERSAAAYPVTLEVQDLIQTQTLDTVTVAVTPGELTVTPGAPPAPAPMSWRPELLIIGLVFFVILSFHNRPFTEGLVDALRELFLILIALGVPAAVLTRRR